MTSSEFFGWLLLAYLVALVIAAIVDYLRLEGPKQ